MPWIDLPGLSAPGYIADPDSIRRSTGRQINWNAIPDSARLGATYAVLSAVALAGATTLAVNALPADIPVGTTLFFGENGEFARATAPAAKGAVSVTVQAIVNALESGDSALLPAPTNATYAVPHKAVAGGKIMSQLADGSIVPREFTTVTASHILLEGHVENSRIASLSGVGTLVGGVLYSQLLPDFANASFAAWIGELKDAGCTFQFETYEDMRKIGAFAGFGS